MTQLSPLRLGKDDFTAEEIIKYGKELEFPSELMVLILSALQGASYKLLAQQLGLPEGTVKSRLSRARRYMLRRRTLPRE